MPLEHFPPLDQLQDLQIFTTCSCNSDMFIAFVYVEIGVVYRYPPKNIPRVGDENAELPNLLWVNPKGCAYLQVMQKFHIGLCLLVLKPLP